MVIIIIIIAIVLDSIGWLAMGSVMGRSWGLNIGSYILMTIDLVTDSAGGIPQSLTQIQKCIHRNTNTEKQIQKYKKRNANTKYTPGPG